MGLAQQGDRCPLGTPAASLPAHAIHTRCHCFVGVLQDAKDKAAALKQRAERAMRRAEASVDAPLLPDIHAAIKEGPFAMLGQWAATRARVLVVTRHACGVHGRARGTLLAGDRFMNLVLGDVEEEYSVIIKVPRVTSGAGAVRAGTAAAAAAEEEAQGAGGRSEAGAAAAAGVQQAPLLPGQQGERRHTSLQHEQPVAGSQQQQQQQQPPATSTSGAADAAATAPSGSLPASARPKVRWCRKQEWRSRHLDRILVRGESIVLVGRADEPADHG